MSARRGNNAPQGAPVGLPLLALRLSERAPGAKSASVEIGGCLLTFSKSGKLVVKLNDSPETETLNPFTYLRHEGVIQGLLDFANPRSWATNLSLKGLQSDDDVDFAKYVMLEEKFTTINDAEKSKRVEIIRIAKSDASVTNLKQTIVVPAEGKDEVWMVVDSWHISRVRREVDKIVANVIRLSAPFDDLTGWFEKVSKKIRDVKESSEFDVLQRALLYIKRKSLSPLTLGFLRDDGKLDERVGKPKPVGVWAGELLSQPTDGEWLYAHDLFLQNPKEEEEWWNRAQFLDVGFVSLQGAPLLGVPPASEVTRAVLGRYITANEDCFDSKKAVLSRVKMDRTLSKEQKCAVRNLLHRRRTFVIKDALYRYRTFLSRPHVNVILKNPMNGYSQIMLESVDVRDCPVVLLRLVPRSKDWPTTTDLEAEAIQISKGIVSEKEREQQIAYRELITSAAKPGSPDKFTEGAKLVIALEELAIRDGENNVLQNALKSHRPGVAEEYCELAQHFKRMYAVNISENVLIFLLVLMLEDQTPYAGWMTRKIEAVMHRLRINEEQYEKIVSGVVAAKTAFFFGEGLLEAWEEGFGPTTLIRGLSYSFTWSYISPGGNLEFFGHSLVENAPDILALGPLFGATKFGLSMLEHAKHGLDKIADLQRAAAATSTESKVLTPEDVVAVFKYLMEIYMKPWNAPLSGSELTTGELDEAYGEYTFDSTPLGVPSSEGGNSVQLIMSRPGDREIEGVTNVVYDMKAKKLRINGRPNDGKTFQYEYYAEFVDERDAENAHEIYPPPKISASEAFEITDSSKGVYTFKISNGVLEISNGVGTFKASLLLFFDIKKALGKEERLKIIQSFVAEDCYHVSGTERDSRLGVAMRVALLAVVVRAMELAACSDSTHTKTILKCLLRGEDHLPDFESCVLNTKAGPAISEVSRKFCARR